MTKNEASDFLKKHQPLPSDDFITQEQLDTFDKIRQYLIESPDPEFIPLMLNAFGNGSGFGVYQLCDDVFRKYSKEQILPHLSLSLINPNWGVRHWSAHWVVDFPDEVLVPILANLIDDEYRDCQYSAITALESIWREKASRLALDTIRKSRDRIKDLNLLELINDIIKKS